MNNYETTLQELPALRRSLGDIKCEFLRDAGKIGSAIAYLVMLEDLLKAQQKETPDVRD